MPASQTSPAQLSLFDAVADAYGAAGDEALPNEELYERVRRCAGVDQQTWSAVTPIGRAQKPRSVLQRQVRWHQQSLRALGLLERVPQARGVWRLTPSGKAKLTKAQPGERLVAFSTDLGVALWASAQSVFPLLDEPIHLILSSLPYPLNRPRAYGNPTEAAYVDWACDVLAPVIANLAPTGSLTLNVGNDVFRTGTPARSMYVQRLAIALHDRFGLDFMDTLIWENPSRPPGPLQWASLSRQQLNATYENVLWFARDARLCAADNRRVLQPHSAKHQALIARGGEQRKTSYGDGAHRVRPGSYSQATEGRIPRNVLSMSHMCAHKQELIRLARRMGAAEHGATMPLRLAQFLVEFLTKPGDLVVDTCAGYLTTAFAAELTGRRWLATEQMAEYLAAPAAAMRTRPGFEADPGLQQMLQRLAQPASVQPAPAPMVACA